MKSVLYKLLVFFIVTLTSSIAIGQNFKNHKWKNRILIIQTTDTSSNKYKNQINEFKGLKNELKDRKLVIYKIVNDRYLLTDYKNNEVSKKWKTLEKLNKKIGKKETFKVILIGLDGRKKLKKTTVITKEDLFTIIDAMPMRQSELFND